MTRASRLESDCFSCCTPIEQRNMASGYVIRGGAVTLGIRSQRVCRNIAFAQVREKKRWTRTYELHLANKLRRDGAPPPKPRSQKPNWDYHVEVQAFSARLHENFSMELLKTAFVNPCYLQAEQKRRQDLGLDSEVTALVLKANTKLSAQGADFSKSFLNDWCRASFPNLPDEGVESVVGHLTSLEVVTYVAKNLGMDDLTMSAEFPLPDDVLHATFMAVIGALHESSGAERTGFFIRDFLVSQMIGKELFDIWTVKNPMGLLVEELTQRNLPPPEPRLIRSAGSSTVLPLYFVGLYSDKTFLAQGPGETLTAAEDEAARVALRRLYGYTQNCKPFDFSPQHNHQKVLTSAVGSS
ncbi:large ribosomal subunit protein mL44 isoform 1-T1 [Synchiropus picturatus]